MNRKITVFHTALLWFGAGVSMSEILAGTTFAPLGIRTGTAAILLGHLIGCILLFLAGWIGAATGKNAMETVAVSFGRKGSLPFSLLNVFQLGGWLAILNYDGALAAGGIFALPGWLWCLIIGVLLFIWTALGRRMPDQVNFAAMAALFVLTVVLCIVIAGRGSLGGAAAAEQAGSISFGEAVELAAAMPVSWLPVISDYTGNAEKPGASAAVGTIVYGLVSCWMYFIGMFASAGLGTSDIAKITLQAGIGLLGLLVILFSTVTTNYIAANSAGVSADAAAASLGKRLPQQKVSLVVVGAAAAATVFFPMDNIAGFLTLIGSVFTPMAAVMIASFFIEKKRDVQEDWNVQNILIWLAGLILYRLLMRCQLPLGATAADALITIGIYWVVTLIRKKK